MDSTNLLSYEASGCGRTAVNRVTLAAGESLPLTQHPEERLYYFLDGRGIRRPISARVSTRSSTWGRSKA